MKYTAKQYGLALAEAIQGKKGKEIESILNIFFSVLKKNRDLSLANKIFGEFEKKYSEENGIFDGEISFARHADTKLKNSIEKKIVERGLAGKKIKELRLREVVDKGLIGGFKLRVGGMLIDASINRALNKIKDELSIVN